MERRQNVKTGFLWIEADYFCASRIIWQNILQCGYTKSYLLILRIQYILKGVRILVSCTDFKEVSYTLDSSLRCGSILLPSYFLTSCEKVNSAMDPFNFFYLKLFSTNNRS